jgi:hypothetical protein
MELSYDSRRSRINKFKGNSLKNKKVQLKKRGIDDDDSHATKLADARYWKRNRNVAEHKQSRADNFFQPTCLEDVQGHPDDMLCPDEDKPVGMLFPAEDKPVGMLFPTEDKPIGMLFPAEEEEELEVNWQHFREATHLPHALWKKVQDQCLEDDAFAAMIVLQLARCKCCKRHQIDRPKFYAPRGQCPSKVVHCHPNNGCICICRILSRMICSNLHDANLNAP